MKWLAHAIIIMVFMNLLTLFPQRPGVSIALGLLQPGDAFAIFSASVCATLHRRKALIPIILGLVVVLGYPFDLVGFSKLLIPQGVGLVLGDLTRSFLVENTSHSHDTDAPR